jgi:glycosyltransferase involved in cell wall biosynthesis
MISVLMPVYNGVVEHLQEAINSVLNQTFKDFELLIVDDGSTDSTIVECLRQFEKQDNRIRLIHCEKNAGIVDALNLALDNFNKKSEV